MKSLIHAVMYGFTPMFHFVEEFVLINIIERFTEAHDNDNSLLTLI